MTTAREHRGCANVAAQYKELGIVKHVTVIDPVMATTLYAQLQKYEEYLGGEGHLQGSARFKTHLILPWVWDLVHHPVIVDHVCALLGTENILCWSTDFFIKEPGDGKYTSWHQDSTYVGLDPPDVLTVWLALTPSNGTNGALKFIPGSHQTQVMPRVIRVSCMFHLFLLACFLCGTTL